MAVWGGSVFGGQNVSDAAASFHLGNPTSTTITIEDTEVTFKEDRESWIEACVSKLKSDDPLKNRTNCRGACEREFDTDLNVTQIKSSIDNAQKTELVDVKTGVQDTQKKAFALLAILLLVGLSIYFLTKKSD